MEIVARMGNIASQYELVDSVLDTLDTGPSTSRSTVTNQSKSTAIASGEVCDIQVMFTKTDETIGCQVGAHGDATREEAEAFVRRGVARAIDPTTQRIVGWLEPRLHGEEWKWQDEDGSAWVVSIPFVLGTGRG